MAGALLFLSQSTLVAWTEHGRVGLEGSEMEVREGVEAGTRHALRPAVRFLAVAGGGADAAGLVGRVKTHEQLEGLGAEVVADSVILGDSAYEVEPGFVAEALAQAPEARRKEAEALARFLLDNLP